MAGKRLELAQVPKKRVNALNPSLKPGVSIWQQIGSWPGPLCFRITVLTNRTDQSLHGTAALRR